MSEQIVGTHGIGEIVWDHVSVPTKVWKDITRLPNGCWQAPADHRAKYFREVIVERMFKVNARNALAITPTCGDHRCVNPEHVCVTMQTPLSFKEM